MFCPFIVQTSKKYIPSLQELFQAKSVFFTVTLLEITHLVAKHEKKEKKKAFNSTKANNQAIVILNSYRFIQIFSGFIFTFL